jgi:sensor histidine kinase YesM
MMTKEAAKEYAIMVLVSAVGSALMTWVTCTSCHDNVNRYLFITWFSFLAWILIWIGNGQLSHFISTRISWVQYPLKRFTWGIISTVIYTVGIVLLVSKLWEFIYEFQFDNYYEVVMPALIVTFILSLFIHSREFLIQWKKSAVDSERSKKESVAAQYESLKNQVNPHFLFNSLNALTSLVYQDQDKAAKFIKHLSEVYRYVLDSREKELVSLGEELSFLQSYVFLQEIRFGSKLRMVVEVPNLTGQVAPLGLQLLIENAIKHNEISEDQPLTIKIYLKDGFIVIENNLQRKKISLEDPSGLGLENIKRRYEFLSDRKIKIEETDSLFKVEIPILFA